MLWRLLKFFLFKMDPEKAHYFSMDLFSFVLRIPILSSVVKRSFRQQKRQESVSLFGLQFNNRVGLAAGFDKDGKWLDILQFMGFGFIEVGTVTPLPQSGNNKPRLFRLKKDEAIINRMGFNNEGVDALVSRLKKFRSKKSELIIGGNIGKNKSSEGEQVINDYKICFTKLVHYVDYFVINVSSPNTPNLRALQDKEPLHNLLSAIQFENNKYNKPLFLKIAPDLSESALNDIIEVVQLNRFTGIIATNTTIARPSELREIAYTSELGGLSGKPLRNASNEILKLVKLKCPQLVLIGVGGINSDQDAVDKFDAGADLIQVYSGMIYQGPWFIKSILNRIS
ncbi:MAG: quinone-dependent dihydroorotate dehydrogenase [Saprospiraceae bacterium]